MIGRTISHYHITEKLGGGGMGVVYKADDTRLKRLVALKFLPPDLTRDDNARERFVQEAQAASALDHTNICTIYEIDETEEGQTFIAMAYYPGETLKKKIERGPLPVEQAVERAIQVAQGLERAHEEGIIHRDIKPANVMVTDRGVVKVVDFGLAKVAEGVALTQTGRSVGTPAYMSPEQARGEAVDARTDVWSLGVVLYEMLTGARPFRGDYEQAVIYSILNVEPELVTTLRPEVPEALAQVVEKALAKRPDDRYPDLDDLLADLQALGYVGEAVLRSPPPQETAVPVLPTVERHVVGRERERAQLHQALASVASGHGLLLGVAGEPGIGKTTLVEAFLHEASADGPACLVARGQCSERLAGAEAYLPILDVLDSLRRQDVSVAQAMRRLAPVWYLQVVPHTSTEAADLIVDVQSATQERMKRELATFLQDASRSRPLVLIFEDLHWADVSTIDLLAYLAARFEALPVLVVATYRPADLQLADHAFLKIKPDLQARGHLQEITLDFLSRTEVEHYLALEFPEHSFAASFAALIHHQTEGSPLFMVDLIRDLHDRSVIVESEDAWCLAQSVSEIELGLPESVQGMIERKIDRLGEDDRRLLVGASVQGYVFDSAVVTMALGLEAEEVEDRLDALERVHSFVRLLGEEEFPEGDFTLRYQFVHAFYQNALYESLRPTKRVRLSKAVAEALLGYYGAQREAVASELAVLFEAARDYARAVECYSLAARSALQVSAFEEVIVLARRGLALMGRLPEGLEKVQQELDVQLALGAAICVVKGFAVPEVEQAYTRAHALCRQLGETPPHSPSLFGQWHYYLVRAAYQRALDHAEDFFRMAQQKEDSLPLVLAHAQLGVTRFFRGEFVPARVHLEKGLRLYDPEQHQSRAHLYGIGEIGSYILNHDAEALCLLGYPDQALERLGEALALAQELNHPFSITFTMFVVTLVHFIRREVQAVAEHAEATMTYATEYGFPQWALVADMALGWVTAQQGQVEDGIAQIRRGRDGWSDSGMVLNESFYSTFLVEGYALAGHPEEGLRLLAEALAMAERTGEGLWEAELHRLQGDLLRMQGAAEAEVEACFRQALDVARRQQAKWHELRASVSLGRLWQQQGRQAEARALLAEIYDWFTEGFDTPVLKEARALLDAWS